MKTEVFDIKRFGRLFATEFKTGLQRNWVSLSVIVLVEVIICVTTALLGILAGSGWDMGGYYNRAVAAGAFVILLVMVVPSKLYGYVNNVSSGPSYLMLPASRLEKFLSMVLNGAIFIPGLMLAVFLGIDAILAAIQHGNSVVNLFSLPSFSFMFGGDEDGSLLSSALMLDDLVGGLLFFLLGAVFFKTHKVAKTVLSLVVMVHVLIVLAIAVTVPICSSLNVADLFSGSYPFFNFVGDHAGLCDTISDTVTNVIILVCIWFKLKSLKF